MVRVDVQSHAFDALASPGAVVGHDGVIVATNAAWRTFADLNGGCADASGPGVDYLAVCDRAAALGSSDAARVAAGLRGVLSGRLGRFDLEYPCGSPIEPRWFLVQVAPFDAPDGMHAVVLHLDVTRRRLLEDRLRHEARVDALTGLANRTATLALLEERAAARPTGLILVDLDDFKPVNDRFGHPVGDDLLVHVGARIGTAAGDAALVGRLGGDEFLVVHPSADPADLAALAECIEARLAQPYRIGAVAVVIGASAGCAVTAPSVTVGDAIAAADREMYRRKRQRAASRQGTAASPEGLLPTVVPGLL
jgi:diguanylate cyclase (GGDEF)-like protein